MALKITVAGWQRCSYFQKTANVVCALQHLYPTRVLAEILELPDRDAYRTWLPEAYAKVPASAGHTSSPLVWTGESDFIGGCDATLDFTRQKFLSPQGGAKPSASVPLADTAADSGDYDYDLIVIGGGSGGLACSKRAASYGKKVAVLDFVKPSPAGTKWGLGGTCVNVGCIPKKLMHTAALLGEAIGDAKAFGWQVGEPAAVSHDWGAMVAAVQDHIKKLNFGYRVQLREEKVKYLNKLGKIVGPHQIECTDRKGKTETLTARRFVVAVGGRPSALTCPGGDLAISSDDLFSMKEAPGKTLVVGASYVALECAGFLAGLKGDVTVMVRSILLRGFDRDMADRIGDYMGKHGTKFIRGTVPEKLEKMEDGRIKVTWAGGSDVYDTVFSAIGRTADTRALGLDTAGVECDKNGKLSCTNEQAPGAAHVYAIGDVVQGMPELTPVAIQAGKLLADRLYNGSTTAMDYEKVCTAVFTPIEYGCCGLGEEDAAARLGDNMEVYHTSYTPLEWQVPEEREENSCYCKVVVDKADGGRVVGLHLLGPNAGEITQGFGTAMKMGMTYTDLVDTVGIHPTTAEELTTLTVTKSSGESTDKGGC